MQEVWVRHRRPHLRPRERHRRNEVIHNAERSAQHRRRRRVVVVIVIAVAAAAAAAAVGELQRQPVTPTPAMRIRHSFYGAAAVLNGLTRGAHVGLVACAHRAELRT
ncbi:hypothetical protein NESM_000908400 [Novymonas esmeraldas]|uniref:Uncharacterized protein n=1 Tax=Novymonas esmeraldas TaxID=1808958 RepID=A0AAW0F2Q2_9TRYP